MADLTYELTDTLKGYGLSDEYAGACGRVISESTCDGVVSHGIARFPWLIQHIKSEKIDISTAPACVSDNGARQQWDGGHGLGIINALTCTKKAVELAHANGLSLVALRNTTHWLRGGTYGWLAADMDCALIAWTNTTPNMPPWGLSEPLIGNNPLVIAIPRSGGHFVLDMAMSQYSYGKLNEYARSNSKMPTVAGYDIHGQMTDDPQQVLDAGRPIPSGFWKGSGLSIVLDLLAAGLSDGSVTAQIDKDELNVSQIFFAISLSGTYKSHIDELSEALLYNTEDTENKHIRYPGQQVLKRRIYNMEHGVPVPADLWEQVKAL